MSHQLTRRQLIPGGIYHVFNRGNGKKIIFREQEDYLFFLSLFDCYLLPQNPKTSQWVRNNFHQKIHLLAFCLMPNHFHFCVQQEEERDLPEFLRSLCVRYAMYFNKKYDSVGHIFQDKYKARLVQGDVDLINLSRYIHLNPHDLGDHPLYYPYSSFLNYCQSKSPAWLNIKCVLDIFSHMFGVQKSDVRKIYQRFVLYDV